MRVVVVPSLAKSEYPQPDPQAASGAPLDPASGSRSHEQHPFIVCACLNATSHQHLQK